MHGWCCCMTSDPSLCGPACLNSFTLSEGTSALYDLSLPLSKYESSSHSQEEGPSKFLKATALQKSIYSKTNTIMDEPRMGLNLGS